MVDVSPPVGPPNPGSNPILYGPTNQPIASPPPSETASAYNALNSIVEQFKRIIDSAATSQHKLTKSIIDAQAEVQKAYGRGGVAFARLTEDARKQILTQKYALEELSEAHTASVKATTLGIFNESKAISEMYKKATQDARHFYDLLKDEARERLKGPELARTERDIENQAKTAEQAARGTLSKQMIMGQLGGIGKTILTGLVGTVGMQDATSLINEAYIARFKAGGAAGRIAGYPMGGGGALAAGMMGGIPTEVLGPEEKAKIYASVLGTAPKLLGQNLTPVMGYLGRYGVEASESAELMAQASRESNISVKGLVDTLAAGEVVSKKWSFDLLTTTKFTMNFASALRQTGLSAEQATLEAQKYASAMIAAGTKEGMSVKEIEDMSGKFSGALKGISIPLAAGIHMFMTGRMPTGLGQLEGITKMGGVQNFYQRMKGMVAPELQMYLPGTFAQTMGIGQLSIREAKVFESIMNTSKSMQEIEDRLKQENLQNMDKNVRDGVNSLRDVISVNKEIRNILQNTIVPILEPVGRAARHHPDIAMGAMGTGAGLWGGAQLLNLITMLAGTNPVGWGVKALAVGVPTAMGMSLGMFGARVNRDAVAPREQ